MRGVAQCQVAQACSVFWQQALVLACSEPARTKATGKNCNLWLSGVLQYSDNTVFSTGVAFLVLGVTSVAFVPSVDAVLVGLQVLSYLFKVTPHDDDDHLTYATTTTRLSRLVARPLRMWLLLAGAVCCSEMLSSQPWCLQKLLCGAGFRPRWQLPLLL